MKLNPFQAGATLLAALLLSGVSALAAQAEKSGDSTPKGVLELECNLSQVDLYLCPRDKFLRKTTAKFFGLFKSHEESCSGGQLFLGATPLKPRTVPAGQYVLLIPPGYAWEHKGPVEINIEPGERSFLLQKLFSHEDTAHGEGPEGSPGGGGSGSGGAPGTPPP